MQKRIKAVAELIEDIGLVALGVANVFAGAYLWGIQPLLAPVAFAVSLICIARGVSELLEAFFAKGKR